MSVWLEEIAEHPYAPSCVSNSSFAPLLCKSGSWVGWHTCREVFQTNYSLDDPGFWYYEDYDSKNRFIECMNLFETMLGIGQRTTFQACQTPTRLDRDLWWVVPSPFWKQTTMHINILTLFIRVAHMATSARYPSHRWLGQDLHAYEYTSTTLYAVERFLMGFTKYVGPEITHNNHLVKDGWYSFFKGKTKEEVDKMLVRP